MSISFTPSNGFFGQAFLRVEEPCPFCDEFRTRRDFGLFWNLDTFSLMSFVVNSMADH